MISVSCLAWISNLPQTGSDCIRLDHITKPQTLGKYENGQINFEGTLTAQGPQTLNPSISMLILEVA